MSSLAQRNTYLVFGFTFMYWVNMICQMLEFWVSLCMLRAAYWKTTKCNQHNPITYHPLSRWKAKWYWQDGSRLIECICQDAISDCAYVERKIYITFSTYFKIDKYSSILEKCEMWQDHTAWNLNSKMKTIFNILQ